MLKNKIPLIMTSFLIILSTFSVITFIQLYGHFPPVLSSLDSKNDLPITIVITGDVMLGRSVNSRLSRTKNYSWPFQFIGETFRNADLTYVNLESPLTSTCMPIDEGMKFCGHINNVATLTTAGVDVASLANNHALDYGLIGLKETKAVLNNNHILVSGAGEIALKDIKGFKIAIVSFNDVNRLIGVDSADQFILSKRIGEANALANFVIATFHWGREYEDIPTQRQVSLGRTAVDLGADLVVGSHPHWIQPKEIYHGIPIYYSLGNTIFDQEWSESTRTGLVLKVYIRDSNINRIEELVLYSSNYGQPRWQTN